MRISWKSKGEQIGPEDVSSFEADSGLRLPEAYREFLVSVNGGVPESNYSISNAAIGMRSIAGIGPGETDIPALRRRFEGRCPADLLPVGLAAGGNMVALSLSTGKVYFWDHEWESEDGEESTWDNLTVVSPSFGDFILSLAPIDEMPSSGRVISATFDPAKLAGES